MDPRRGPPIRAELSRLRRCHARGHADAISSSDHDHLALPVRSRARRAARALRADRHPERRDVVDLAEHQLAARPAQAARERTEGDRRARRASDRLRRGARDASARPRGPRRRRLRSWRTSTRRPDFNATNVRPIVHRNYAGGDLVLPDDPTVVLSPRAVSLPGGQGGRRHRHRERHHAARGGRQGGRRHRDDHGPPPAAEPGSAARAHPDRLHAGRGDRPGRPPRLREDLRADFAYTLDGGDLGEIVYETFSADKALVRVKGVPTHPGQAKDRLVNALHLARHDHRDAAEADAHARDDVRSRGVHPPVPDERHRQQRRPPLHPARLRARWPARQRRADREGLRGRAGRPSHARRSPAPSRSSTATCATGSSTTCARSTWRARPAGSWGSSPSPRPSAAARTARVSPRWACRRRTCSPGCRTSTGPTSGSACRTWPGPRSCASRSRELWSHVTTSAPRARRARTNAPREDAPVDWVP